MKSLQEAREKINSIDLQIMDLLTARAKVLDAVLKAKIDSADGNLIKVFDPKREAEVIANLVQKNKSALPDNAIVSIYEAIMNACRNLQINRIDNAKPFSISIQGSAGSYSEQALLQYCQQKKYGAL